MFSHLAEHDAGRAALLGRQGIKLASSTGWNYTQANAKGVGMNRSERITLDPAICHGKPCIRGLRYPVESLLEWLASGMTTEEILADYEDLEREDVLAALSYAARLTHVKRMERFAARGFLWMRSYPGDFAGG